MIKKVYIGIGTNLGDRRTNIENAYRNIEKIIGKIIKKSSIYLTAPWGFESSNDFYNSVILVETLLDSQSLLLKLQEIELEMGRIKSNKKTYESRLIDLDILDYDGVIINSKDFVIPHPKIQERNFVLIPLLELDSNWRHPKLKLKVQELISLTEDKLVVRKIT